MDNYIPVIVSLVSAAGSIIAALVAHSTRTNVKQIHFQINSRMDELLKLTEKASYAQGVKEQRDSAAQD